MRIRFLRVIRRASRRAGLRSPSLSVDSEFESMVDLERTAYRYGLIVHLECRMRQGLKQNGSCKHATPVYIIVEHSSQLPVRARRVGLLRLRSWDVPQSSPTQNIPLTESVTNQVLRRLKITSWYLKGKA